MNLRNHIHTALFYFAIAAILGVVLRSFGLFGWAVEYKYIVHTHSHIALLGWVYLALTTILVKTFLNPEGQSTNYRYLFWFTQLTLCGMLLTFPIQGYGAFSIAFSTLFLFASYWFFWFFSKHVKKELKERYSYKFIKASLWYMVLSSAGPWALGGIIATLGPASIWYRMAIYFYLHFQYNGWMILSLVGLVLFILEQRQTQFPNIILRPLYWLLNIGVILTLLLSALWVEPPLIFNYLGALGAILQLAAVFLFLKMCWDFARKSQIPVFRRRLMRIMGLIVFFKLILQGIGAIPYFSALAVRILDFTIGYLHLTFLGLITLGIFLVLEYWKMIKIPRGLYIMYLSGFALTEGLIFYRAMASWLNFPVFGNFSMALSLASLFLALGIVSILVSNIRSGIFGNR
ncbi:hypothetical protein ACA086_14235 [Muriicola sp. E247]|uniref:hypothetical protein n=1 Tax=unclassified Muriicola TaxID=2647561 RepID=UPI00350F5DFB